MSARLWLPLRRSPLDLWPRLLLTLSAALVLQGLAAQATAGSALRADTVGFVNSDTPGQLPITINGEVVAVYVFADPNISRPYFAHLRPPGGPQVSRNHPPQPGKDVDDHPTYHPGLWMAFGDISGSDYWRLKAPVRHVDFAEPPIARGGSGSFAVRNRYLDQDDQTQAVCEELCKVTVVARPAGVLILWDTVFRSNRDFYFGDQEEMGLGVRVATPIRVERESKGNQPAGNGTIIDSVGRRNGDEIWGNTAQWCDYSGVLDGQHVGITLFCHPGNFRASWFHARDYGLLLANPFGREAFGKGDKSKIVVAAGDRLRLRYGVYVHASPANEAPDLDAVYGEYLAAAGE